MTEQTVLSKMLNQAEDLISLIKDRMSLYDDLAKHFGLVTMLQQQTSNLVSCFKSEDINEGDNSFMVSFESILQCDESLPLNSIKKTKKLSTIQGKLKSTFDELSTDTKNVKAILEKQNQFDEEVKKCIQLAKELQEESVVTLSPLAKDSFVNNTRESLSIISPNHKSIVYRNLPKKKLNMNSNDPYIDPEDLLDGVIVANDKNLYALYLLTYSYYSSPRKLLSQLLLRFCITDEDADNSSLLSFKNSILNFLDFWYSKIV